MSSELGDHVQVLDKKKNKKKKKRKKKTAAGGSANTNTSSGGSRIASADILDDDIGYPTHRVLRQNPEGELIIEGIEPEPDSDSGGNESVFGASEKYLECQMFWESRTFDQRMKVLSSVKDNVSRQLDQFLLGLTGEPLQFVKSLVLDLCDGCYEYFSKNDFSHISMTMADYFKVGHESPRPVGDNECSGFVQKLALQSLQNSAELRSLMDLASSLRIGSRFEILRIDCLSAMYRVLKLLNNRLADGSQIEKLPLSEDDKRFLQVFESPGYDLLDILEDSKLMNVRLEKCESECETSQLLTLANVILEDESFASKTSSDMLNLDQLAKDILENKGDSFLKALGDLLSDEGETPEESALSGNTSRDSNDTFSGFQFHFKNYEMADMFDTVKCSIIKYSDLSGDADKLKKLQGFTKYLVYSLNRRIQLMINYQQAKNKVLLSGFRETMAMLNEECSKMAQFVCLIYIVPSIVHATADHRAEKKVEAFLEELDREQEIEKLRSEKKQREKEKKKEKRKKQQQLKEMERLKKEQERLEQEKLRLEEQARRAEMRKRKKEEEKLKEKEREKEKEKVKEKKAKGKSGKMEVETAGPAKSEPLNFVTEPPAIPVADFVAESDENSVAGPTPKPVSPPAQVSILDNLFDPTISAPPVTFASSGVAQQFNGPQFSPISGLVSDAVPEVGQMPQPSIPQMTQMSQMPHLAPSTPLTPPGLNSVVNGISAFGLEQRDNTVHNPVYQIAQERFNPLKNWGDLNVGGGKSNIWGAPKEQKFGRFFLDDSLNGHSSGSSSGSGLNLNMGLGMGKFVSEPLWNQPTSSSSVPQTTAPVCATGAASVQSGAFDLDDTICKSYGNLANSLGLGAGFVPSQALFQAVRKFLPSNTILTFSEFLSHCCQESSGDYKYEFRKDMNGMVTHLRVQRQDPWM